MGSALERLFSSTTPDAPLQGGRGPAATREKRKHWDFTQADNGWMWHLQCHDGAHITSSLRFSTFEACVENAKLHGYVEWDPERERRARAQ